MPNISQKIIGAGHLSEVVTSLKNADKHIRLGEVHAALDEILYAREKNPTIMYTRAYEEYIRSVLLQQNEEVENNDGHQVSVIQQMMPTLEKILDLALNEVERSAASAYKEKEVFELQKRDEEDQRLDEQQRHNGIVKKITDYINRAREFQAKGDFHNGLNEVARAFLLDPTDERIPRVEEEIKTAQEQYIKQQEYQNNIRQQEENKKREFLIDQRRSQQMPEKALDEKKKTEAYKQARRQKIREYLQTVRELFAEQRLDDALGQLAFVMVLDPLNEEVLSLNWKIREAQTKKQEENIARDKQRVAEERQNAELVEVTVKKNLEKAEEYLVQERFSEAMRLITQSYFLAPTNEDVLACERKILAKEDESIRLAEEKRKYEEEILKQKQEAELHRLSIEQQKREQMRERVASDTKLLHVEEEVLLFLSKARGFLSLGNYHDALIQIGQAFMINPFDDDIAKLQREIIDDQKKNKLSKKPALKMPATVEKPIDHETVMEIHNHAEQAQVLRTELRYQEALDEIAQAYRFDPMNEMLFALEGEIQQEFLRYEEEQQQEQNKNKTEQGTKKSLAKAREALSRDAFGEASAWVDYALSFDMKHVETLKIKDEIELAQRAVQEKKTNEEKEIVVQFHISKALGYIPEKRIIEAIFEIDLALRLNPHHQEALTIRQKLNDIRGESVTA